MAQLVWEGSRWVFKVVETEGGGGMPESSGQPVVGLVSGVLGVGTADVGAALQAHGIEGQPIVGGNFGVLGVGAADQGAALQSNTSETGVDLVATWNLPSANLDTSNKILGTSSLLLNTPASNEYLSTPYNAAFDFNYNDSFSISAWLKTSTYEKYSLAHYGSYGWAVGTSSSYQGQPFFYLEGIGGQYLLVYSNLRIDDGNWHHVVQTYDGTSLAAGCKIYIDGVSTTLVNITETLGTDPTTHGGIMDIGAYGSGAGNYHWEGNIDDVAVWDTVLTSAPFPPGDIEQLYNGGAGIAASGIQIPNLVAYYPLDVATHLKDMSGNNLHMSFNT